MLSRYIKKSTYLKAIRYAYFNNSTEYLIVLRDALNHLIIDRLNEGHTYDLLIANSKGLILYEKNSKR